MKAIRMRRISLILLLFGCSISAVGAGVPKKPKLIVAIVIDQFRYDYLVRFRADYTAGLKQLLDQGAVFDNAHLIHFPSVTAPGHSTFLSGALPSRSGIIGDDWYDRDAKKNVTSVQDDSTKLIGGTPNATGSSPRRLMVSTVGDEIRMKSADSKVIGIATKDRAAILPGGRLADAAYWYDDNSNHWVTSSYYREALPAWVKEVNDAGPQPSMSAQWFALNAKPGDRPFCSMLAGFFSGRACGAIEAGPWGNEMTEDLAERALTAEKLGHHDGTDVLTLSFSGHDYVGHTVGPDAPEIRDLSRRIDLLLGKLLAQVGRAVGLDNVLFVLTADHGVAPLPEVNEARHMPGGRLSGTVLLQAVDNALSSKYGAGNWIVSSVYSMIYLDRSLMEKYKVSEADVDRTAAEAVRRLPHIFRVYTAEELAQGRVTNDAVGRTVTDSYYAPRSANLTIVADPYYLFDTAGTSHGSPFDYDTHVPVIFMGAGIKPGRYDQKIALNDIAPTLAVIAGVPQPSGSSGRVLRELWQ